MDWKFQFEMDARFFFFVATNFNRKQIQHFQFEWNLCSTKPCSLEIMSRNAVYFTPNKFYRFTSKIIGNIIFEINEHNKKKMKETTLCSEQKRKITTRKKQQHEIIFQINRETKEKFTHCSSFFVLFSSSYTHNIS